MALYEKSVPTHAGTVLPGSIRIGDPSPRGAAVLVKLASVEHVAGPGGPAASAFDLEVTITDGGRNPKGKYEASRATIAAGSTHEINAFIFTGEYASIDVGAITFEFEAETAMLSGTYVGVTTGDDELHPGIQNFTAPVKLDGAGETQSTLIFRGRIDLG